MLLEGIKYKGQVWARAIADTGRFVAGHKVTSFLFALVLSTMAQLLIFGETARTPAIQPVASLLVGCFGFLLLVFLWSLYWAPFQIEEQRAAESERITFGNRSEIQVPETGSLYLKKRPDGQNIDLESINRLEDLFRDGEAILKESVGGIKQFLIWRDRVYSWNDAVMDALPKAEQFAFETIAEWAELTAPIGDFGMGGDVNRYVMNGKAYLFAKKIKLRKIIIGISEM